MISKASLSAATTFLNMDLQMESIETKKQTSLPYFRVKPSCVCLMFAYKKKVMTYSDPMVTYSHPKMTYSYPKVT